MPAFQKVCPSCMGNVHVRKSKCPCGHSFSTKPKLILKSENAMKSIERRRNSMAECQARKRTNETVEKSESRKRANVECHARKRANETLHQFQKRKQANLECQTRKRNQQTPLQSVIQSFIVKTKQGPDCVCKSCHRLVYKQSVVNLSVCKYVKASPELLSKVFDPEFKYSSHGGQEWVCKTCHAALTCGKMPTQAIPNGLKLSSIPPELSCLNSLELRLISLRLYLS